MLAASFDESLVRALHNALGADVNPAARRHLAVHHQARTVQFVEMLPGRPFRHQVGVGNQHARRTRMGAKNPNRFARLNQQCFIGLKFAQ